MTPCSVEVLETGFKLSGQQMKVILIHHPPTNHQPTHHHNHPRKQNPPNMSSTPLLHMDSLAFECLPEHAPTHTHTPDDIVDPTDPYVSCRRPARSAFISIPFAPSLRGVRLRTTWSESRQILEAAVSLQDRSQSCGYAVDPATAVITFIVTRRWQLGVVGVRTVHFPRRFNWDLGKVVDEGDQSAVWVCRWPRLGEQLVDREPVVDIIAPEGDNWFGMETAKGKGKA